MRARHRRRGLASLTVPLAFVAWAGLLESSSSLEEQSLEESLSLEESPEDSSWICIIDET
jgi:hypothetical protein